MQPSYQRSSPRTASAANSLQTNPTRTNNQRYDSPYSDTDPYNEKGPDEDEGDMASVDQKYAIKVNQVIQVHAAAPSASYLLMRPRTSSPKLPSRSSLHG